MSLGHSLGTSPPCSGHNSHRPFFAGPLTISCVSVQTPGRSGQQESRSSFCPSPRPAPSLGPGPAQGLDTHLWSEHGNKTIWKGPSYSDTQRSGSRLGISGEGRKRAQVQEQAPSPARRPKMQRVPGIPHPWSSGTTHPGSPGCRPALPNDPLTPVSHPGPGGWEPQWKCCVKPLKINKFLGMETAWCAAAFQGILKQRLENGERV